MLTSLWSIARWRTLLTQQICCVLERCVSCPECGLTVQLECPLDGRWYIKSDHACFQDSSSVMEWDQVSGGRSQQVLETQQSYETEWDMVNTVSFKKRPCSNTECEFTAFYWLFRLFSAHWCHRNIQDQPCLDSTWSQSALARMACTPSLLKKFQSF